MHILGLPTDIFNVYPASIKYKTYQEMCIRDRLNHGVITRVGNQINLGPPFIITYREIEDLCWRIDCALSQIRCV